MLIPAYKKKLCTGTHSIDTPVADPGFLTGGAKFVGGWGVEGQLPTRLAPPMGNPKSATELCVCDFCF